jgi:transcriptional regulator of NAD metabolism
MAKVTPSEEIHSKVELSTKPNLHQSVKNAICVNDGTIYHYYYIAAINNINYNADTNELTISTIRSNISYDLEYYSYEFL